MPLYTGFSSADKHGVPQGESTQSDCHRAGQHPEEDDALMSTGFSETVVRRRGLIVGLYSVVGVQKQVPAADAAVDTAHGHVDAEGEEVAMVEMAHAVIQPGTMVIHLQNTHVADAAVVCPRWFGSDAFLTDGHERDVTFVLWWVSWRGGGCLVIMEHHHNEKPVATTEVPRNPVCRVRADDCGQDKQVDDDHNRGCQQDDKTDKHHSKPVGHVVHNPIDGLKSTVQQSV